MRIKLNKTLLKFIVVAGLLLLSVAPALALNNSGRSYQLPGHGQFQLQVPESWQDKLKQPPDGVPPTIRFTPKSGPQFEVFITAIFAARPGIVLPEPIVLRSIVEKASQNVKSKSIEQNIQVLELKGPAVDGYYFSVTDRAPAPTGYKHITQGMFRVGDLAPTFTVLTNDDTGKILEEALTMLKNAVQVK